MENVKIIYKENYFSHLENSNENLILMFDVAFYLLIKLNVFFQKRAFKI